MPSLPFLYVLWYNFLMRVHVMDNFAIGQTHLGKSIFAARLFKVGDVIAQFTGPLMRRSELPKRYTGRNDRYIQVGIDEYLGPSGEVDDLINHSCDPNAGLKFTKAGILLVAIKKIKIGDEITWDYSTTLFENPWKMRCDCRKPNCRKIIKDFALLDKKIQDRYRKLDVIPPYIKEYMDSEEYRVYTKGVGKRKK